MAKKYYVLMMDIIESSKLSNRDMLTEKLETGMSNANSKFQQDCFAPFEITRGILEKL